MEHIISVTVENKFGSLSRIAGLFSGRGFNIESLSVAPTLDPSMSQMTIVTSGDERIIEQIVKQLNKLIDVIKVVDLNESDFVSRETALIKVHTRPEDRAEALRIADIFRANVIDSTPATYTIEVTGDPEKSKRSSTCCSPSESRSSHVPDGLRSPASRFGRRTCRRRRLPANRRPLGLNAQSVS